MKIHQNFTARFMNAHLKNKGFALIATILVMSLLMLISVAILSLSSIETRQSSVTSAQAQAQANARLALALAITQLQETAGSDRRITARADITQSAGNSVDPSKKYLTGVWSTEDWDPATPNDKTFLDWIISNPSAAPLTLDYVNSPQATSPETAATLVGKASVALSEDYIYAPKVPISGGVGSKGSYAYVALDNGIKASYKNTAKVKEDSEPDHISALSSTPRAAIEMFEEPELVSAGETDINTALSQPSLDLYFPAENKVSKATFHDISPMSYSLLTDVRDGGFKRDLSSAFELSLDKFNELEEFHNSKRINDTSFYSQLASSYNSPIFYGGDHPLGFIYELGTRSNNRIVGPTWDLLRNHYNFYKSEQRNPSWSRSPNIPSAKVFAARGEMPLSYASGENAKGVFAYRNNAGGLYSKASRGFYGRIELFEQGYSNNIQPMNSATAPRITPSIIRYTLVLGLTKRIVAGEESVAVSFYPFITVHNPYNVAIGFDSLGFFQSKMNPVGMNVEYTDEGNQQLSANLTLSNNYFNAGSVSSRMAVKSTPYVLQPGEVKVLSPKSIGAGDGGQLVERNGIASLNSTFEYNEESGIVALPSGPLIKPKPGSSVTLKINARGSGNNELDHAIFSLMYKKNHNGSTQDLDSHLPPKDGIFADTDILDTPYITKISYATHGSPLIERTTNESQIPRLKDGALYVGAVDIRMKDASDDISPFTQFNPRSQAVDPRDYEGRNRVGPGWTLDLKPITDITDLELAADVDGTAHWGGGTSVPSGSSKIILYEIPRIPILSIGQLQHTDISVTSSGGSMHIGNSFPHPGITNLSSLYNTRPRASNSYMAVSPQTLHDTSWLANEALWDRYFFSGLHYGSDSYAVSESYPYSSLNLAAEGMIDTAVSPFLNPRIQFASKSTSEARSEILDDIKDYSKIAKHLMIEGGFNVNSTSVEAWKAILGGLREQKLPVLSESSTSVSYENSSAAHPSAKYALPDSVQNDNWNGIRSLTDTEIDNLAIEVVKQVKERGPFMGLSDFVNRRLQDTADSESDSHKLGALQMAIEAAGLNDSVTGSKPVTKAGIDNKSFKVNGSTKNISTMTGAPSYLMQADILSHIGSQITARSDTFTVRAYGEVTDATGKIIAQAWCEAQVQRTPNYVVKTDLEDTIQNSSYPASSPSNAILDQWIQNPNLPEAAKNLGRRFKVTSFCWLSANEV